MLVETRKPVVEQGRAVLPERLVIAWRLLQEHARRDKVTKRWRVFTIHGRWNPIRGVYETAICMALRFDGKDETEALDKAQAYLKTYFPHAPERAA